MPLVQFSFGKGGVGGWGFQDGVGFDGEKGLTLTHPAGAGQLIAELPDGFGIDPVDGIHGIDEVIPFEGMGHGTEHHGGVIEGIPAAAERVPEGHQQGFPVLPPASDFIGPFEDAPGGVPPPGIVGVGGWMYWLASRIIASHDKWLISENNVIAHHTPLPSPQPIASA